MGNPIVQTSHAVVRHGDRFAWSERLSRGAKRPHEPVNEHADAWRQLPVAWIQQRDRRRRGRTVLQYSDQRPSFQIGLDVIERHLDQSQAEARRRDEALGAVD